MEHVHEGNLARGCQKKVVLVTLGSVTDTDCERTKTFWRGLVTRPGERERELLTAASNNWPKGLIHLKRVMCQTLAKIASTLTKAGYK